MVVNQEVSNVKMEESQVESTSSILGSPITQPW